MQMREDYWLETCLAFVGHNIKDYHFAYVWYYHYFLRLQWGLSLGFCGLQQGLSLDFCSLQQWLSLFVRLSQTIWSIHLKRSRLLAEKDTIGEKVLVKPGWSFPAGKFWTLILPHWRSSGFVEIIQETKHESRLY